MDVTVIGRWGGCCRASEACAGYVIRSAGTTLLLDCGSGVASHLQKVCPLTEIDHVIITHWHPDHASDAGVLLQGRLVQMLMGATSQELVFYAQEQEPDFLRLTWEPYAHALPIDETSELSIGSLHATFLRTRHPVPCLAVRLCDEEGATLVYTADGMLTDELAAFCTGADLLLAECSLYAGSDGSAPGHMNADDVAELARRAAPHMLVLTHLPLYGDVDRLTETVRAAWGHDVYLAGDLVTYTVPSHPEGYGAAGDGDEEKRTER